MADGSDLEFQKQHQVSLTAPSVEDVNTIIKQVLDENIGNASYPHKEAVEINQRCVETITKKLVMLNRPYKYIVNSALLQTANSTGLNVSTISYWNKQTDMSYSYRWDSRHMLAIVYVFAVAL